MIRNEYEEMITKDLLAHKLNEGCDCPFPCPKCNNQVIHWDMGMEGHWCSKCDYYDGLK